MMLMIDLMKREVIVVGGLSRCRDDVVEWMRKEDGVVGGAII